MLQQHFGTNSCLGMSSYAPQGVLSYTRIRITMLKLCVTSFIGKPDLIMLLTFLNALQRFGHRIAQGVSIYHVVVSGFNKDN